MTSGDVLHRLRTATAADHERVEATLDLLDPALDRARLARAMTALHGFWAAAEAGLARWAARHPDDADRLDWSRRRRAHLYEADLRALAAPPSPRRPALPDVVDTDGALGRMYVLEGATLGGTFIDRHLSTLPALTGVRLQAFSPYGERTGAMWHAYRGATRAHVAASGDAGRVVDAACDTFATLADWVGADPQERHSLE
jgi:heme oxygenase (biliverdin-IX-beta and delta-forming)